MNLWDLRSFSKGYAPRSVEMAMSDINRAVGHTGWRVHKLSPGRHNCSGGVVLSHSESIAESTIEQINSEFFEELKRYYSPDIVRILDGNELLVYKLNSKKFDYTIYGGGEFYFYAYSNPMSGETKFACSRNVAGFEYINFVTNFPGDYLDEEVWQRATGRKDVRTHTIEANKILHKLGTVSPFEQNYPAGATRYGFPNARDLIIRQTFGVFDGVAPSRLAQIIQRNPMVGKCVKVVQMQGSGELLVKSTTLTIKDMESLKPHIDFKISISKGKPFLLILKSGEESLYLEMTEHQKELISMFGSSLTLRLGLGDPKKQDAIRSSILNLFSQIEEKGFEFEEGTGIFRRSGIIFPVFKLPKSSHSYEQ